jgi:PhnB protein
LYIAARWQLHDVGDLVEAVVGRRDGTEGVVMQFLVVAYDGADAGALERRMRARTDHLARLDEMVSAGNARFAGAIRNDDDQMIGSMLVVDFPSRDDVDRWLETEPYVVGDVWRDITVTRCGVAPQFAPVELPGRPPAGYHSVTPRMVVADVAAAVDFLRTVFGATGEARPDRPAEVRIGDSLILVSPAVEREPFPAFLYVYVDDVDGTHRRALDAGATSVEEPLDTPYGDRRAMVQDPFGNLLQIAHPLS